MPQGTKVFESTMTNGIRYEVHEAQGFSDLSEIAIKVEGEVAVVLTIEKKRSGNLVVKPSHPKAIRVRPAADEPAKTATPPNVDDVLDADSPE